MLGIKTLTPLKKKISLYSDFRKDLEPHPVSKDIALRFDEDSVKESIKNLLLTDRGERLMQPNIGGNIRSTLFQNNTPVTLKLLQEAVKDTINNYEPRATVIDVETISNYDESVVSVNVIFYVINLQDPVSLTVLLERTR